VVAPLGEAALTLSWSLGDDVVATAATVGQAWRSLAAAGLRGVVDIVPAPASLLVRFDPLRVERGALTAQVAATLARPAPSPAPAEPRARRMRVRYGGADGPDLRQAAARLGLDPAQLVRLHSGATYTVLATGFSPGFVYLGPLDRRLVLPRRDRPRTSVPAGSVAIAARQTGVYGLSSAGGWWIIGRTTARTFAPRKDPPALLAQGDRVRFVVAR